MKKQTASLQDTFGRTHQYLRISLTERCNLRCHYCMPLEGVALTPASHLMTAEEIGLMAKTFVAMGVTKIRLTGGEPLVRKDFNAILKTLSNLPAQLTLTTNAVSVDRHISHLKACGVTQLNVSLDTLQAARFEKITFRNYFDRVYQNILLLLKEGFEVKLNAVVMKGVNDDEIIDFVALTKKLPLKVRFIEFMPFDGNQWNTDKLVSYEEIMTRLTAHFGASQLERLEDAPNDTAKNYRVKSHAGQFAIISTVTNPFCAGCNRLRLTANGFLKNCLFTNKETDLLTPLRKGENINSLIQETVLKKKAIRAGLTTQKEFENLEKHAQNRSMIRIGG